MIYRFAMFLMFLFGPVAVSAMPTMAPPTSGPQGEPPHMMMGMETGLLDGFLFTEDGAGKRDPLVNQQIAIIVYQGDQQVLTLDKKTDVSGKFQFKNILKNPQFTYELGVQYQEKIYLYPNIQLKANEKAIKIDFRVGEGSPHEIKVDPSMMNMHAAGGPAMGGMPPTPQHAPHPVDPQWFDPFKVMIYGQCAIVLTLAIYFYRGRK